MNAKWKLPEISHYFWSYYHFNASDLFAGTGTGVVFPELSPFLREADNFEASKVNNNVYEPAIICPLSMHQFLEISICALKKKFKHFDVERHVKVCALTGLSCAPPPKL